MNKTIYKPNETESQAPNPFTMLGEEEQQQYLFEGSPLTKKLLNNIQKYDVTFLTILWNAYVYFKLEKTGKAKEVEILLKNALAKEKSRLQSKNTGVVYRFKQFENGSRHYYNCSENTGAVLKECGIEVKYNEMKKEVEIDIPGNICHRDIENTSKITMIKDECAVRDIPFTQTDEHLVLLSNNNIYHPVRDFLTNLKWDGKTRINELLGTVKLDAQTDEDLAYLLLMKWLVMCVAAIMEPNGICPQGVLTLVGNQGLGKTTWIKSLVPDKDWVGTDISVDPHNKDDVIKFTKNWIVELGELDATFRKADIAALKPFISRDKDIFRAPYGRTQEEYVRRTAFFGSVNGYRFLVDDENRRFWPFGVIGVNAYHKVNIKQLWAEAKSLYENGERWWLNREEHKMLNEHNATFEQLHTSIERVLAQGLVKPSDLFKVQPMNCTQILMRCGQQNPSQADLNALGKYLRKSDYRFINNGKSQWEVAFSAPTHVYEVEEEKVRTWRKNTL